MNSSNEDEEIKIGTNFILYNSKKLGKGAFGEIHLGRNTKDNTEIAIKKEDSTKINPQLNIETKILLILKGGEGIPNVYYYQENDKNNFMVMDLLGSSIEDLFNKFLRNFTAKTILMIGMQMISRVQYVHSKGFIHRDIKPDNFLIGQGKNCHLVFLIDFGLAKRYKDPKTGIHIKYKDGKSLTGTARYASVFTLLGIEQSRRDDLESIAYSLIYMFKGDLPWQGLKAKTKKEKYAKILDMKKYMRLEELCLGIHRNIINFLIYCRELNFEERPDYEYLYSLLEQIFEENGYDYDFKYDWVKEKESKENNEKYKDFNNKIDEKNKKISINNINLNNKEVNIKINNDKSNRKSNKRSNNVDSDKDTEEYIPKNLDYGKNK